MTTRPEPPAYADGTLASVLPAVARSLGSTQYASAPDLGLSPATRAVVVLVDGLGHEQLTRRAGHAPFLRSHLATTRRLDSGFPSTTATAMGSLGTGRPPGTHGLAGYEVLDPDTDRVFNELSWEDGPDPFTWQPYPTVFQALADESVAVTRIGPGFFDGSGLTNAALRGGRFVAATSLADRVDAAVLAAGSPRSLVYLYWGDVDKVGHVHGPDSWEWVDELEAVDRALARLAARLPADCVLHVTADHGMVDAPYGRRVDLAAEPELMSGVRHVAWEPRATQLHTLPGALEPVVQRWQDRLGDRAWVATRDELVALGWFGAVRPEVLARIGDVLVILLDDGAVVDSARMRPEMVRLRGFHGSVTEEERAIPLVTVRRAAPRLGAVAELVFFGGTMDCGKSTLALQTHHNHAVRGRAGLVFTKLDRAGTAVLSSRLGLSLPAREVTDDLDFWEAVVAVASAGGRVDFLICDEAQFYTRAQVDQLARLVDEMGVDVFAFGITTDFRAMLFPGSCRLVELADRVQQLQVEALCWCGRRATHNARVVGGVMVVEGEQVVVGDTSPVGAGEVEYEVLCRRHHTLRMTSHAARAAALSPDVLPFDLEVRPAPPR